MSHEKYIISTIIITAFVCSASGQWTTVGPPFNIYARINPIVGGNAIRAVGIGVTFPGTGGLPQSRLHVSEFGWLLPPNGAFGAGNLFRTDGLFANTNTWRMYTGTTSTSSFERFNLTVPGGTSDLQINTMIANSNIFLNADGNNMIHITSTASAGNNGTGQLLIQPGPFPQNFPLMDIGGTIRFSEALAITGMAENTLFYGYTNAQGNPALGNQDGFRAKYMNNAQAPFEDCLVFEKTDANEIDPDGCIRFTNTGNDGVEELAMTIEGNNFVGVGSTYTGAGGTNLLPWRRLSVNDPNGPQLRLTNIVGNTINNGQYTDLHTTGVGNLEIDPRNNGISIGNVGTVRINYGLGNPALFPNLSLDVNGQVNIRTINQDNTLNQVLVWEPLSGNIRWSNSVGSFGQDCTIPGTPGQLNVSRKLPMNNNNFYFEGQSTAGLNSVGIGYANCPTLPAKLSVRETGTGSFTWAVFAQVTSGDVNIGGEFDAFNGTGSSVGVRGIAVGPVDTYGAQFKGAGGSGINYGVITSASSGIESYGIRTSASGAGLNYAIFATCLPSSGTTPPTGPNYAGWFDGDVVRFGGSDNFASDSIFKTDIDSIYNAIAIINQLIPRTFFFDTSNYYLQNASGMQYGFIAQEVEPVMPSLIANVTHPASYDSAGVLVDSSFQFKSLNYQAFIPIMMKGIQEQQSMINEKDSTINSLQQQLNNLQQQIDDLAVVINNCCGQGSKSLQSSNTFANSTNNISHTTDVRLSDSYCVLGENSPNPFKDHTVINYTLSETIKSAQIVFYNTMGQVIKVIEIEDRGAGRLNVYAEDLRSGIYTYSLIVDGNICESKKMIKE